MPQVCAASSTVWVRADRQGTGLHLAVEDAGPGVPSELRAVVFERLHHGETAPSYAPGLGSGLSLVHLLAELHGGTAWIMADIVTPAMRSSHRSHHS